MVLYDLTQALFFFSSQRKPSTLHLWFRQINFCHLFPQKIAVQHRWRHSTCFLQFFRLCAIYTHKSRNQSLNQGITEEFSFIKYQLWQEFSHLLAQIMLTPMRLRFPVMSLSLKMSFRPRSLLEAMLKWYLKSGQDDGAASSGRS